MIQAPGLSGTPRVRPRLEGRDERVLDGLLGEIEVAEDADQGGHRPALLLAEQAVDDGVGSSERGQRSTGSVAAIVGRQPRGAGLARGLASAIAYSGRELPDRADLDRAVLRRRDLRRGLDRLVEVARLDQVEAAERLLRLGERPVGRDGLAVDDADGRRGRGRGQGLAGLEQAARLDVRGERGVGGMRGGRDVVGRRLVEFLAVDQEQVAHRPVSSWWPGALGRAAIGRRTADGRIDSISRPPARDRLADVPAVRLGELRLGGRARRLRASAARRRLDERARGPSSPSLMLTSSIGRSCSAIARSFADFGRANRISTRVRPSPRSSRTKLFTSFGTSGTGQQDAVA